MRRFLGALLLTWPVLVPAGYDEGLAALDSGDYRTAYRELLVSAEQGDAAAQYKVGSLYEFGLGVGKDFGEATRWYRKAARQGHTTAQHMVGLTYAYGLGVPRDPVVAHMWLDLAADGGHADAGRVRDALATGMSREQIADARRLAREWQPGR
jgi:TPR repeat protein